MLKSLQNRHRNFYFLGFLLLEVFKYLVFPIRVAEATTYSVTPTSETDNWICYMQTADGRVVNLTSLCTQKTLNQLRQLLTTKQCHKCDLSGVNLSETDLHDANLSGANLTGANLKGANLLGANLTGANLKGANLLGANLAGSLLKRADLSGATMPDGTINK
ncbi:pentapeptide repeat-containing protein [Microcoleus sp. A006_D1]|uniref:pentapeptide repeat-containing protein n=1 Tax=Microcoleus sp. A006_D1 TaxID=3055267 RepID=UPI002FD08547